jgi:hypothetical protein
MLSIARCSLNEPRKRNVLVLFYLFIYNNPTRCWLQFCVYFGRGPLCLWFRVYRPKVKEVKRRKGAGRANPSPNSPPPARAVRGITADSSRPPALISVPPRNFTAVEGRALGARASATLLNQAPSASPIVTSDDAVGLVGCACVAVQRR